MEQKEPVEKRICKACEKEKSIESFNKNATNGYISRRCKICVKNNIYMVEGDYIETKKCKACSEIKLIKEFNKTYNTDGYTNRCKLCVRNKILIPNELKNIPGRKELVMELYATSKKDYVEAYKFIESMGYSLQDDIHLQFCKKYNLTPRTPKKKFLNHYSQKDCGLI